MDAIHFLFIYAHSETSSVELFMLILPAMALCTNIFLSLVVYCNEQQLHSHGSSSW